MTISDLFAGNWTWLQLVREGRYYVDGCTCWHERAKKIIGFLIHHDEAIAEFLTLEKLPSAPRLDDAFAAYLQRPDPSQEQPS
jgi:hypothetical protein